MIDKDPIVEELERIRGRSTFARFVQDPKEVIRENPIRIGYISGAIAAVLMVLIYIFNVEFVAAYDAYILAGIAAFILPAYYIQLEDKRIKKAEEVFPDLLHDLAQAKKAGLSLVDAFALSSEVEYGVLTETMRNIANQLTWGVSFDQAMGVLAKRFPTPMIKRSVNMVIEGYKVGGDVALVLQVAANDATELKTLELKRVGELAPYTIISYLTFFVFLGVLAVLNNWLIPMMTLSGESMAGMAEMGEAVIADVDVETPKMIFFHCAIIEGICAGLVAGKLGDGKLAAGIKHALILSLSAFACFVFLELSAA
jgi:flagellar protein FlaJ